MLLLILLPTISFISMSPVEPIVVLTCDFVLLCMYVFTQRKSFFQQQQQQEQELDILWKSLLPVAAVAFLVAYAEAFELYVSKASCGEIVM